ncbi:PIG-U-domain-containing protein [Suhomyces tanzawaensis NRRL Y-17324]|uniref:PIG-U-domain-containing protein n=1 Tax=Suhomyces tanzawaensis NRRL Y-17324 TaxID=984487 RepID=A0A1E4SI13_9ASCO|nr:PIG-U-domain-containing protein [Suhomyces tanzawaensis NRRL Y-17324]ODV79154.1 PIG-U-domain-containing protein [Suhomyces tanzawaensis NRRL Y-17324]
MSKLVQVYLIGAVVRFVLPVLVPSITHALAKSVLLSTPMDSFPSLEEAFYYLEHGIGLYDGGIVHHPPLLVILLLFIHGLGPISSVLFNGLWACMDLFIVTRIIDINKWYNEHNSNRRGRKLARFNDDLIASFYLFNPLLVLSNLLHSTLTFALLFLVESIHQLVVKRRYFHSAVALAASTYFSVNLAYLVIPMTALALTVSEASQKIPLALRYVLTFVATLGLFLLASFASVNSWLFVHQVYGTVFFFDKITPNLGLWWYLFTEMFEFFSPFYVGLYNLYSFVFILPMTLRFYEGYGKSEKKTSGHGDSFLAVVLGYIWISFTKSYPTVGDLAFAASLLPLFKSTILPYCRYTYITALGFLVSLLLSPIFYYCWIVLATGNSNFFYSISLIWGAVHTSILMDLIWGKLTSEYIEENKIPEKDQKTLRLTQI